MGNSDHRIYLIKIVVILLSFGGCSTENELRFEGHPEGMDYDSSYRIEVTQGQEVISSTLIQGGHHRAITVTVSAFNKVFVLDLHLNTYLFAAGYVERSFSMDGVVYHDVNHTESHCYYLGTVRDQLQSSAAVSTCKGVVGYFTVGNVSYHIDPVGDQLNGPHRVYRGRGDSKTVYRCGHDSTSLGSLQHPEKHNRRRKRFTWPQDLDKTNKIVELYVADDHSQYISMGSNVNVVIQRTKDIVNIASAGYQPLGIYIVLVGVEVWNTGDKIDTSEQNSMLSQWNNYRMTSVNPIHYNDVGIMITNHNWGNVNGLASLGSMCKNRNSAAFVSDIYPLPSVAGAVMDHELGHVFGLNHDNLFNPCVCSDPSGSCIMSPGVNPSSPSFTWSQCSEDQFAYSFEHGLDICLYNVPQTIESNNALCGNGIVESGEQCDCGKSTDQECNKDCCDSTTCQLVSPATCAYGRCCNINTCQILPCGNLCRGKSDVSCDLDEFCDGQNHLCPNDTHISDGANCTVGGVAAHCYNGLCRSHQSQCELLWGPGTLSSSFNMCYNFNKDGAYYGNCGMSWLPNVTYAPCAVSDMLCGTLYCQDLSRNLSHYLEYYTTGTGTYGADTCHFVIFDFGLHTQDPGYVPSGASCGAGKMCVDQQCLDVSSLNTPQCANNCQPNEVCNNIGQCQSIVASCPQSTSTITTRNRTTNTGPTTTKPVSTTTTIEPITTEPFPTTTEPVPTTTKSVPTTTKPVPRTTTIERTTTKPVSTTTTIERTTTKPVPTTTTIERTTTKPVSTTTTIEPTTTKPVSTTTTIEPTTTKPVPTTTTIERTTTKPVPTTTTTVPTATKLVSTTTTHVPTTTKPVSTTTTIEPTATKPVPTTTKPFSTTTTIEQKTTKPVLTTTKPVPTITNPVPLAPFSISPTATTSFLTTTEHTTSFFKTYKSTMPISNSRKATALGGSSSLMDDSKPTTGVTNRQVSTSPSKDASGDMPTAFYERFVSKTFQTTTEKFNPCDTLSCVNGTCFTDNNTSTCACIGGYRGPLCVEEIAECDSNPCQHDSTCIDELNSYHCQCLGGYTGRNCETDLDECESNPCPINSTCEDSINRYQCICPNPDEFIGIRCNISVPLPKISNFLEFVKASPNHGPISGGTKLTVEGRNLDQYGGISFVYIGDMKLPTNNWTSSWSQFSVVTTAGESSIVGQGQNMTFEITGGKNISSTFTFTYYPDPEIQDVKPIEQLASGGTTLTVIGNNLNSSASPYLRVILNTTTPGRLNKNITMINGPTCDVNSSSEIYCLMPRVNVAGTTVVTKPGNGQRTRREANSPNITTNITLILISDDAEDSPNKSVVLIAYRGVLDPVKKSLFFNPDDDPFIHIKGRMLSDGIGADDYEVIIGVGVCTSKSLTGNELSCKPPTEEPDSGNDQTLYCTESSELPVNIFVGRKVDDGNRTQLHWTCLVYPGSIFSWWIVGVICGGCALLLALTVVGFVLCRRRLKLQRKGSAQRGVSTTGSPRSHVDPGKSDWTRIQVNALGKLRERPRNMGNDTYASRITDEYGLNDYRRNLRVRTFSHDDYNRTLASDCAESGINIDERNSQMTHCELDMTAAERNALALQNPVSVRYSYMLLAGDNCRDDAPQGKSGYANDKSGSEVYDWRNQGHGRRPTTQKQFRGSWKTTDDDAISVAPALRANRHDFFGQNSGLRSPLYKSFELPTTSDSTRHKFGHRGQ